MRKLIIFITSFLLITSCATTNETKVSRSELRNEKKLAEQETVKKAVESRRFIIKLDRLYFTRGGMIDLMPRANYIIVDGNKAIISAAYLGRQYEIKPIAAINMFGKTSEYKVTTMVSRGNYEIKMKVDNGNTAFNVFLEISKTGYCSASLNTLIIDNVRYSGHLVPIKDKTKVTQENNMSI